jgi:hypothetical protein
MKKYCENCGFENAEKDKFCRKCGIKLADIIQPIEQKTDHTTKDTTVFKKPEKQLKSKKTSLPKEESNISVKMILGIAIVAFILSIAAISSAFLISPTSLNASSVGTNEIANNSVTSQKVADGTITDSDINPFGISRIKANSISGNHILNYTLTLLHLSTDLADKITGTTEIANNSITSDKIKNGTINTSDLANNCVTSVKIKDGAVTNSDIANNAVISSKIAADAVTSTKIASGAVDTSELADGAVTYNKMDIKIRYGHNTNVVHGDTITHNLGATPTSVIVTPRFNSSLPTNATIIANVYDVGSTSFKIALSVCVDGGNIAKVDGSTWGAEDIDWIAIRTL